MDNASIIATFPADLREELLNGLPPLVLHQSLNFNYHDKKNDKGKEKVIEGGEISQPVGSEGDIPILLFVKLLKQPLFLRSIAHLEQVMGLLQVIVYTAASKLESQSHTEQPVASSQVQEAVSQPQEDSSLATAEPKQVDKIVTDGVSTSDDLKKVNMNDIFMKLLQTDLHNLCSLLGHEGSLTVPDIDDKGVKNDDNEEHVTMWKLNLSLELLWQELSECISVTESQLAQGSLSSVMSNANTSEHVQGTGASSPPLPPGTQRLFPFIEAFLVLCEKLLAITNSLLQQDDTYATASESLRLFWSYVLQQDDTYATASEVKELSGSSSPSGAGVDGAVTFSRFAEKHHWLLNAFVSQNPGLLEKSLSMMLKAPRLIDFDNKRSYFRSRIRQQHDQHLTGPLRISVRRAYVLEDSYNQLRMRPTQDLKGRLNVHFQGEEGIDAGGLTREWYQLLSRVIFDKGALLFTTGGNNATFQPNPNSVYQTEHLSYFKFVGRLVAKALFDGQLLDVYFTRSFYKHILGVKVTYDIEVVDPDYYKNLKWLLENDVSDILDLTFSMDADEEMQILYEKYEVCIWGKFF
ncbi:E3 ubiquitin protein ligase UPL1-like protein [Tanacetum coccineum]|uniref:HECT-type E3 ubiquitin transferase n=1 Tax=Tanacetum coccineum TaxID=301880 RepID=A0ABQ5J3Q6_9ASTR